MPDLEYQNVRVVFDVRKKGTEKYSSKTITCNKGKGSINFHTFLPPDGSGVLTSTKGIYLPKTTSNGKS